MKKDPQTKIEALSLEYEQTRKAFHKKRAPDLKRLNEDAKKHIFRIIVVAIIYAVLIYIVDNRTVESIIVILGTIIISFLAVQLRTAGVIYNEIFSEKSSHFHGETKEIVENIAIQQEKLDKQETLLQKKDAYFEKVSFSVTSMLNEQALLLPMYSRDSSLVPIITYGKQNTKVTTSLIEKDSAYFIKVPITSTSVANKKQLVFTIAGREITTDNPYYFDSSMIVTCSGKKVLYTLKGHKEQRKITLHVDKKDQRQKGQIILFDLLAENKVLKKGLRGIYVNQTVISIPVRSIPKEKLIGHKCILRLTNNHSEKIHFQTNKSGVNE